MLWERQNRFVPGKQPVGDSILTYASFSEYLRQQFKQSRNLFTHNNSSKKSKQSKHSGKQSHEERPNTPPTQQNSLDENKMNEKFLDHTTGSDGFFLTQGNETEQFEVRAEDSSKPRPTSGVRRAEEIPEYRVSNKDSKKKKSMTLMKSKVMPSYSDNVTPGPGEYNVTSSLVKPTFNRVYSEPVLESAPSYLRPTAAHGSIHLTDKSLWNSMRRKNKYRAKTEMGDIGKPIIGNNDSYLTKTKLSAKTNKTLTRGGQSRSSGNMNTSLYGKRYPPLSEKLIRRWQSVTHDSFPDYSKRLPLKPANRTTQKF